MKNSNKLTVFLFFILVFIYSCTNRDEGTLNIKNVYPWCIVAFDSVERSPVQRISMLQELGFNKYAYDWRDKHLNEMESELRLAKENNIEVISVWLWLNAKRDSLGRLNPSNERIFEIIKKVELKTALWLSFNNNFFKGLTQEQSLSRATEMIEFIHLKADELGCKIELYNHGGWFGDPYNMVEIIKAIPQCSLRIVYNFHHAHQDLEKYPQIFKEILPYLSSVNINGMRKDGPKILPVGKGDYEKDMIKLLINEGFTGPWGVLGHVENDDVKKVLEQNISGIEMLQHSLF